VGSNPTLSATPFWRRSQSKGQYPDIGFVHSIMAAASGGRVPVIFDSGIRRGIDVFRALSLGAQAVALGRPALYGLAVGGAPGVRSAIEHLRDELQLTMLLAGARTVKSLSPDNLRI
jgi:lactate oxidase